MIIKLENKVDYATVITKTIRKMSLPRDVTKDTEML